MPVAHKFSFFFSACCPDLEEQTYHAHRREKKERNLRLASKLGPSGQSDKGSVYTQEACGLLSSFLPFLLLFRGEPGGLVLFDPSFLLLLLLCRGEAGGLA